MRQSICGLLVGSLLMSSCAATTQQRTEIPASVNDADRERCEQFAQSEADVLKGTASWTDPLAGAIGGGILGPVGAGLGALIGTLKLYGNADADNKARQATYEEVLKDCLEPSIVEANGGPENSDLAQAYITLADRFNSAGKYDEAELRYQRALAIQEKVLGPNHPDVVTTLEAYARVLAKLDRQSEAEEIVGRYLAIRERLKQESKARNVRPKISMQLYQVLNALTDSFLKNIADEKCTVMAECVGNYAEQIEKSYPVILADDAIFQSELQIATDADKGKITKDEALTKLQTVTMRHLVDIYFARSRVYSDEANTKR